MTDGTSAAAADDAVEETDSFLTVDATSMNSRSGAASPAAVAAANGLAPTDADDLAFLSVDATSMNSRSGAVAPNACTDAADFDGIPDACRDAVGISMSAGILTSATANGGVFNSIAAGFAAEFADTVADAADALTFAAVGMMGAAAASSDFDFLSAEKTFSGPGLAGSVGADIAKGVAVGADVSSFSAAGELAASADVNGSSIADFSEVSTFFATVSSFSVSSTTG